LLCVEALPDELPVFIDILLTPLDCKFAIIMTYLGVMDSEVDDTLYFSRRFAEEIFEADPPLL